jgi:predicted kinase
MSNKMIIITGHLAAGKTTFSTKLSEALQIPCLQKDTIKSVIGKDITMKNRDESKLFSNVTFHLMMYVADLLMSCGYPYILEGNFTPHNEDDLRCLLDRHGYEALTFLFHGDISVLHQRFLARDLTSERDPANKSYGTLTQYCDFEDVLKILGTFSTGNKIVKIDCTDFTKINDKESIEIARKFLCGNYTLEREKLHEGITIDEIAERIRCRKENAENQ